MTSGGVRIAEAIKAAVYENNLEPFYLLNRVLEAPFTANPEFSKFTESPKLDEVVTQTFCGTLVIMAFPPERIVCLTEETVETLYLLGQERKFMKG